MRKSDLLREWRRAIALGVERFELTNWIIETRVVERLADAGAIDLQTEWRADTTPTESQRVVFTIAQYFQGEPTEQTHNLQDLAYHECAHCKIASMFWRLNGVTILADPKKSVLKTQQWEEAEEMLCEFMMALARRGDK